MSFEIIKGCPFCGTQPSIGATQGLSLFQEDPITTYTVRCKNVNCVAVVEIRNQPDRDTALKLWNERDPLWIEEYDDQ